jgi:hypothetical protein
VLLLSALLLVVVDWRVVLVAGGLASAWLACSGHWLHYTRWRTSNLGASPAGTGNIHHKPAHQAES